MKGAIYDRYYNNGNDEIYKRRKDRLYKIAKENSMNIEKEYLDYNPYKKGEMLEQLLKDIQSKKIENVIFYTRNFEENLEIRHKIECAGGKYIISEKDKEKADKMALEIIGFIQESYRKEAERYLKKYKGNKKIQMITEENFDLIKDKKIPLGRLLLYAYNANVVIKEKGICRDSFDLFSEEQYDVKIIPKEIIKRNYNRVDVIIDFANEKEKEKFEEYEYSEDEEFEDFEDDEMEY